MKIEVAFYAELFPPENESFKGKYYVSRVLLYTIS